MLQVGYILTAMENDGILDRYINLAFKQATCGPLTDLWQWFLTCRERNTLSTRSFGINVHILTACGCALDTFSTAKRTSQFARVLLPVDRRPAVTLFQFPSHPLMTIPSKIQLSLRVFVFIFLYYI